MNEIIKFICQYHIPVENDEGRTFTISSNDKASYIHDVLVRLGYTVEVVSPTSAKKTSKCRKDWDRDNVLIISGFSLGWYNSITRALSRFSTMVWLFFYMLRHARRYETVFIYHGVQNIPVYLMLKRLKKLRYVLEVEEVYSSLAAKSGWRARIEKKMIEHADAYIFASEILEKGCNKDNKPYAIAYGAYRLPVLAGIKQDDGKKHVVYAGLIRKDKVAFTSLRIAKYLPADYHVHIIGYGEPADIDALKNELEAQNKTSLCQATYDGLRRGKEYESFLQSCHIGVCPLVNDNVYQLACFPSKITSYLSNGLQVVTTENPVLRGSHYRTFLHFVTDDTPQSFAKAVESCANSEAGNPRDCLTELDSNLVIAIGNLVK